MRPNAASWRDAAGFGIPETQAMSEQHSSKIDDPHSTVADFPAQSALRRNDGADEGGHCVSTQCSPLDILLRLLSTHSDPCAEA